MIERMQILEGNRHALTRFLLMLVYVGAVATIGAAQPGVLAKHRQRRLLILILVWLLTVAAILPVIFHWQPPPPAAGHAFHLQLDVAYVLALVICYSVYRAERRRLPWRRAVAIAFLVLLLTSLINALHLYMVDRGSIFPDRSNLSWQIDLQNQVINLSPSVLPHSYRFLPNSIVRWMQLGGMSYETARDAYRLVFNLLLFYAIYRYARLYTSYTGAIIAMLLIAGIYPVGFIYNAGQLTDPLSHLSFVLAFIFVEGGDFAAFLSTLLIGSLAKETVLALAGYYLLFCRKDSKYASRAVLLSAGVLAAYFGVRLFVLNGTIQYSQVSGVSLNHAWANWQNGRWPPLIALTAGALLPLFALAWKQTAPALKHQALFLLPVLFVSSTFFSWLFESHNFMPAVFVLAVIAGRYLSESSCAEPRA